MLKILIIQTEVIAGVMINKESYSNLQNGDKDSEANATEKDLLGGQNNTQLKIRTMFDDYTKLGTYLLIIMIN